MFYTPLLEAKIENGMVHPRCPLRYHYLVHSKKILLCRNRTNSWCRSHMYILTCFAPLYVVLKIVISTIRYFFNARLFSNVVIMTLNYVLCPISVQNPEKCTFWRYIYISPASTHSDEKHNHSTKLPLYNLHKAYIERRWYIRSRTIIVRKIVTLV